MTIRRVAMVVHSGKERALELQEEMTAGLSERGIEVSDQDPDLVLSLGGDGTMLRAAQFAHAADALLLGVNLGSLGYLTEVDAHDKKQALDAIVNGDFTIEDRMMLACTAGDRSFVALNEVLVERTARHLVRLQVSIGGEALASFSADGMIVATPTGSTAYALSAGGPIVSPKAECLVVVPVSAHMIFDRPFVLSAQEAVDILIEGPHQQAALSLDGAMGCELDAGSTVTVGRHPRPLRLVRLTGPGFIERLRIKLGLPG